MDIEKIRAQEKKHDETIPIDFLMRYATLPTEFAISEWRKAEREAKKKQIISADKPMSLEDALQLVNEMMSDYKE